jgi:pimeloyl-ACP methyl ester carboxylesterase
MKRSRAALSVLVTTLTLLLSFGLAQQTSESVQPSVKQMTIEVVKLKYVDQGKGEPVVFVHGAVSDHRVWEEQREEIVEAGYRYIALDLRYHGDTPWTDDGAKYSMATHISDLAAFIEQLDVGSVHVVGWSGGSDFVIGLGVLHPELVRSLFLYEPALSSVISDPEDLEAFNKEGESFGPVFTAAQEGDLQKSTRLLIDWVNDQPGTFAGLPAWRRNVILSNSRTWGPALFGAADLPITCDQLGQIKVPVTVAKGKQTRPNFAILAKTTNKCIPGSQLVAIPKARHLAPGENPSAFNKAVLSHLKSN